MRWSEMESRQPRLAAVARSRLLGPGVLLVATIRRDGTPRLSPVEPLVLDGTLWLSMMLQSRKARDLQRDARVLVHSIVTSRDGGEGEVKLRGRARLEENRRLQVEYARAVGSSLGWSPEPGLFHLFEIDFDEVTFIRYDDATGDQHVVVWPPGREYIRRGTSATTLGPPEDVRDLLV